MPVSLRDNRVHRIQLGALDIILINCNNDNFINSYKLKEVLYRFALKIIIGSIAGRPHVFLSPAPASPDARRGGGKGRSEGFPAHDTR